MRQKSNIWGSRAGVDLELQLPENPDIRLTDDGAKIPEEMCRLLIEKLEKSRGG